MSDMASTNPFAHLIPDAAAANPFADLIPQRTLANAATDIPAEVTHELQGAVDDVTALKGRGSMGPIDGLLATGKAALAPLRFMAAIPTGIAHAVGGNLMTQAEHATGSLIAPDIAAKDNLDQMYEASKGDIDKASMAAGASKLTAPAMSAADLKTAAKAVYNDPGIKAIQIHPDDVRNLSSSIQNELLQRGDRPMNNSAPRTFSELQSAVPGQGAGPVGIDDLRAVRRALNKVAAEKGPDFKPTQDAAAATHSIGKIDDFISGIAPELADANANYAASKRSDMLDFRMDNAERRAARSGIGGNVENTMRQEADKIPDRGLTADEQALRDKIVMGDATRNTLRTVGKLGVDGGLSLALHAGVAMKTGGHSLPLTVAATAARKVSELLTKRQMGQLSEMIRARAPASQNLPPPSLNPALGVIPITAIADAKPTYIPFSLAGAGAEERKKKKP